MKLEELVDSFEKMCQRPIDTDDELLLYETGTFSFMGPSYFYFSLVRQFPDGEGEYYQIHLDVLYEPSKKCENFSDCVE